MPLFDRDLLRTKFAVPQPGAALIQRRAPLARLNEAAQSRVTLISAPAGFGKTTLVAQWLGDLRFAIPDFRLTSVDEGSLDGGANRQSSVVNRQSAWLSLDAADNDPVRFWRYVINACRVFDGAIGRDALDALRAAPQADVQAALTAFINDLSQSEQPRTLVLDDLHLITSGAIHESLTYWLERSPEALHVMLMTREDPPLPLARLRGRGQLRELHAADLRLSLSEAKAFAEQFLARPVSTESVARLDKQLEGWPAGWRMALVLMLAQPNSANASDASDDLRLDVAPQHIIDYFVSEVLAAQPPDIQDFLLRTAFLQRLHATLCDAVTGRGDSHDVLARLERSNLFLQRLHTDKDGIWYRTHALFAEALRQAAQARFDAGTVQALLARAGIWFEHNDALPEAIEVALGAGNDSHAADLIERYLDQRRYGELDTLRRWLERVPQDALRDKPAVLMAFANAILYTGDRLAPATPTRIEPLLQQAEAHWRTVNNQAALGQVLAFRSVVCFWQGDYAQSAQLGRAALHLLPDYDAEWRGISLLQVGVDELRNGRLTDLPALMTEARALCAASGNKHAALAALIGLAEVYYWRGEFVQATLYCSQTLEEGSLPEFAADRQGAHVWLARIALERNDMDDAAEHVARAIALGTPDEGPTLLDHARLLQLHVEHAKGNAAYVRGAMQRLTATTTRTVALREVLLLQAHLALVDGDVVSAQRALGGLRIASAHSRRDEEMETSLTAWLLIVQNKHNDALQLARRWREDARANERDRSTMTWATLEALAHMAKGDEARARLALTDALVIAQRAGITQPLVEMKTLLAPALHRTQTGPFAHELLALMGDASNLQSANQPIPEPLSASEQRVLRLLAAGMTNADIARELTVSVNTVKTQVRSIFSKLNVKGRDEAREVARRLRLV